jgi:hypothetical protein
LGLVAGLFGKKERDFHLADEWFWKNQLVLGGLIVGVPGTGKSTLMKHLLHQGLELHQKGEIGRILCFDPKMEFLPIMDWRVPEDKSLWIMNAFDARTVGWDIAKEIEHPGHLVEMAYTLIQGKGAYGDPFWTNQARLLLYNLLLVLHDAAPGKWRLRHLVGILMSLDLLRAVLRTHETARGYADTELQEKKNADDNRMTLGIFAEVRGWVLGMSLIAAAYETAKVRVSSRDFLNSNNMLVLGWNDTVSKALGPMHTLFLKYVADRALVRQTKRDFTLMFLDELPSLPVGHTDILTRMFSRGRSSGIGGLVACQDLNQIYASFGNEKAETLLATLGINVVMQCGSHRTCQFFSQKWGAEEKKIGTETNYRYEDRWLVKPAEINDLPMCDESHPYIEGFMESRWHQAKKFKMPWQYLDPPKEKLERYLSSEMQQDPERLKFRPLTPDDLKEINIDPNRAELKNFFASRKPNAQPPTTP